MKVKLIALEDFGEAHVLRLLFERLGCLVLLAGIGRPSQLFEAFDFAGQPADLIVISGHGDDTGFHFPTMASGVDNLWLPNDRIGALLLAERLGSISGIVLSTACGTGSAEFAQVFLDKGAGAYIAPFGYPEGAAVPLLLGLMLHQRLCHKAPWPEAVAAANAAFAKDEAFMIALGQAV